MKYVNHNGRLLHRDKCVLPVDNRAFRFGYSVFETGLMRNGAVWLGALHWERLFAAMEALLIPGQALWTPEYLEGELVRLAQKNCCEKFCRIRIQVYAGSGGLYDVGAEDRPGFLAECFSLENVAMQGNSNGLVLGIAAGFPKAVTAASPFKTGSGMHYAVAARIAKREGWNDALIVNTAGRVIESTIANLFWVKDGQVFTPPVSEGCIAGVERAHMLRALPERGLTVEERPLEESALMEADEVYLTNSVQGVRWAGRIGEKAYTKKMLEQMSCRLW